MNRFKTLGLFALLSLILFCSSTAAAQESDTQTEFWPEIYVFVPLNREFRLGFFAKVTRVEETKEDTEAAVGVHLDYFWRKNLNLRAGYHYGFSLAGQEPFTENRIFFEQTLRRKLPARISLTDRNREELRFVNGDFSARYRNRLKIEREFSLKNLKITPYGSAEAYYDSRFDVWNRNRLTAGVQIPLKRGFPVIELIHPGRTAVLDIYWMRQNDSRSHPSRVRGFGAIFNLYW